MGLTNQETEELDAFLLSDDGRENAMDVSGVDGFLCAVLSGPNVIMPSEWMRWVWDSAEGQQSPEFTSEKQAQRILDLLMRHANDDRKSTRLNSSHLGISYAVFCLKKKTTGMHAPLREGAIARHRQHDDCPAPVGSDNTAC